MLGQLYLPDPFLVYTPFFLRMCGKGLGPRLSSLMLCSVTIKVFESLPCDPWYFRITLNILTPLGVPYGSISFSTPDLNTVLT